MGTTEYLLHRIAVSMKHLGTCKILTTGPSTYVLTTIAATFTMIINNLGSTYLSYFINTVPSLAVISVDLDLCYSGPPHHWGAATLVLLSCRW